MVQRERASSRSESPEPRAQPGKQPVQGDAPAAEAVQADIKSVQHLFLQAFLSRRIMSNEAATELLTAYCQICKVAPVPETVDWLADCSSQLELIGLELKSCRDHQTGGGIVVLVNAVSDEVSKIATEYKPEEIAFFRLLVEGIMTARHRSYSKTWTEALRISQDEKIFPSITKVAAEGLLKSLIAKGWLDMTPSRQLTLSARTLAELNDYLKKTYSVMGEEEEEPEEGGFVECHLCMSFVSEGYACPRKDCDVRMHYHCTTSSMRRRTDCPADDCTQSVFPSAPFSRLLITSLFFFFPLPVPPSLAKRYAHPPDHHFDLTRAWLPSDEIGGPIGLPIGPKALGQANGFSQNEDDSEIDQLDDATQPTQPKKKKKRVSAAAASSWKRKSNARVEESDEEIE